MSFLPSNIKNRKQIEELYRDQIALLNTQIENDNKFLDAIEGREYGVVAQAPRRMTAKEKAEDENYQMTKALDNLKKIFEDEEEAINALYDIYNSNGIEDIKLLNRNFPFIYNDISGKFGDINADFFNDYYSDFKEVLNSNKALLNLQDMRPIEINIKGERRENMEEVKEVREERGDTMGEIRKVGIQGEYWTLEQLKKKKVPTKYNRVVRANMTLKTLKKEIEELGNLIQEANDNIDNANTNEEYSKLSAKYMNTLEQKRYEREEALEKKQPQQKPKNSDDLYIYNYDDYNYEDSEDIQPTYLPEEPEQQKEQQEEQEEDMVNFGFGLKPYFNRGKANVKKIIMGRGLVAEQPQKYIDFGKFVLHYPQLVEKNIFNLKYKSLGNIPQLSPFKVSEDFKDFLTDLIDRGKLSDKLYSRLDEDEKKRFERIVTFAKLNNKLGVKRVDLNEQENNNRNEKMNPFELVRGEWVAGNNNDNVKKELITLIYDFTKGGMINEEDGKDILLSLIK